MICRQLLLIPRTALLFPTLVFFAYIVLGAEHLHARVTAETPNPLKPSGHYMYGQWSLYVPPV